MMCSKLTGFLALLGVVMIQLVAADDESKLIGKYRMDPLKMDEKQMEEFLSAVGYSEEDKLVLKKLAPHTVKQISMKGDEMTVKIATKGGKKSEIRFESGKTFNEKPIVGKAVKTMPTIEKDKLTLTRKLPGFDVVEELYCQADGCTGKYSARGVKAEVFWARIP